MTRRHCSARIRGRGEAVFLLVALIIGGIVGTAAFLQADVGGWRMIGAAAVGMVLAFLATAFGLSDADLATHGSGMGFGMTQLGAFAVLAMVFVLAGTVIGKLVPRRISPGRVGAWTIGLTAGAVWSAFWIGAVS